MGKGSGTHARRELSLTTEAESVPNAIQSAKLAAISRTHGGVREISITTEGVIFTTPARFNKRGILVASQSGCIDADGSITWGL